MTRLERLRRGIIRRVFRARFYGDALEAIAFHPRLLGIFSRRLRRVLRPCILTRPALFIHVPKNAGTSIARALYPYQLGHLSMRHYLLASRNTSLPPTFAVLRDPVDRFLSAYDFFVAGGGEEVRLYRNVMKDIDRIDSVDAYLEYLEKAKFNWLRVDNPGRPQWWYLVDARRRIAVDALFTIESDMAAIADHVARAGGRPIPHHNRTARKTFEISRDQYRRLEKLYDRDIALYRYVKANQHDPSIARGQSIDRIVLDH